MSDLEAAPNKRAKLSPTNLDASVVLVGMRGVGKSTLGLMASAALDFKLIDMNRGAFENMVWDDPQQQRTRSVILDFKENEYKLIVECLSKNSHHCVIILPATCIDYKPTVDYLIEYGVNHPIVHIQCEESRILSYVGFDGSIDMGFNWIRRKFNAYQSCSRFDFFNIKSDNQGTSFPDISGVNVLTLKSAEDAFLRFLAFAIHGNLDNQKYMNPPESLLHSSAVQINFPELLDSQVPLSQIILGADAINVHINFIKLCDFDISIRSVSEFICNIRQTTKFTYPIIVTIECDLNSNREFSESMKRFYVELLLLSIRLGVNYQTVDLKLTQNSSLFTHREGYEIVQQLIKNCHRTKLIATYHAHITGEFWSTSLPFDIFSVAKKLGFKILAITKTATRFNENLDIQQFLKDCDKFGGKDVKVVAYNTGNLGRLSKLLNKFLTITDPIVAPNLSEVKNIHYHNLGYHDYATKVTDKLSSRELNKSLFSSFMLPVLTYYVIGQHVEKSLSPEIHNAAYNALGLPHRCVIYQCLNVEDIKTVMKRPDFGGACVIMPFKLQVLDLVDDVSEHVSRIGALNTMYAVRDMEDRDKISSIKGDNTDWIGIRTVIVSCSSPINGANDSRAALVIGAGGMSRASLYALISTGVKNIYLYNRTTSKAENLAKHFNDQNPLTFEQPFPKSVDFSITVIKDIESVDAIEDFVYPSIIVNCIPAVDITTGNPIDFGLPDFWFESVSGGVFVDIGYEPLLSPSLIKARKHGNRGWIATNGLSYLHAQAISQFEMHTGKIAPGELMKNVLMNSFAAYN